MNRTHTITLGQLSPGDEGDHEARDASAPGPAAQPNHAIGAAR